MDKMTEPTFDANGYPTEETLAALKKWPLDDLDGAMAFVRPIFTDNGRWENRGAWYILATGGWSGCEEAICALGENFGWWATNWKTTKHGGYYEFSQEEGQFDERSESRSGAAAEGSQSHPHPVAEGRQSPGLEEASKPALEAAPGTPIEAAGLAEVLAYYDCDDEAKAKHPLLQAYHKENPRISFAEWMVRRAVLARPAIEKAARDALRPFADFAKALEEFEGTMPKSGAWYTLNTKAGPVSITVEDFERARAALSGLPPPPIERAARAVVPKEWHGQIVIFSVHGSPLFIGDADRFDVSTAKTPRTPVDGSGLTQEDAGGEIAPEQWRYVALTLAASVKAGKGIDAILAKYGLGEPAPMDGGPIAPPPTTSGPAQEPAAGEGGPAKPKERITFKPGLGLVGE